MVRCISPALRGVLPMVMNFANFPLASLPAFLSQVTATGAIRSDLHMTEYNGALYFSGAAGGVTNGYELCKFSASVTTSFSFTGNGNWSNQIGPAHDRIQWCAVFLRRCGGCYQWL